MPPNAGADAVKFGTFRAKTSMDNAGDSNYLKQNRRSTQCFCPDCHLEMPHERWQNSKYTPTKSVSIFSPPLLVSKIWKPLMHKWRFGQDCLIRKHPSALDWCSSQTGKPTIMSTGASKIDEIEWSVNYFKSLSQAPLILMQCTASYPAPPESVNVRTLPYLKTDSAAWSDYRTTAAIHRVRP